MTELKNASLPCPVPNCLSLRKPEHMMCWGHWRRVPKKTQAAIWANLHFDETAYKKARDAAFEAIAKKEAKP